MVYHTDEAGTSGIQFTNPRFPVNSIGVHFMGTRIMVNINGVLVFERETTPPRSSRYPVKNLLVPGNTSDTTTVSYIINPGPVVL
eukprot:646698-Pleurochrysis_carterae.AAC.1